MKLPTLNTPKYSLVVPSTGQSIEYRPFLVKEEKVLLIAQQSEKPEDISRAMLNVIDSCTFGKLNMDELTGFDIEYIFIKIRTKSVGEEVEVGIKCESCNGLNNISINLEEIELTSSAKLPDKIMLSDSIGFVPKHISLREIEKIAKNQNDSGKVLIQTIAATIKTIFDESDVYDLSQASYEEIDEFISSLSRQQIAKIEDIIKNTPKFEKNISFKCIHCECKNEHTLSGLQSFFE